MSAAWFSARACQITGAASTVPGPPTRAALDQNRRESISSRRERIELGIELTPSGSAGAVVRLVAVLVWANRLAIVAVMPTRVNLRILRLLLLSADRRHPVLHPLIAEWQDLGRREDTVIERFELPTIER
jgi:hypothetical protein